MKAPATPTATANTTHAPNTSKDTAPKFLLWWIGLLLLWTALAGASVTTQFTGQSGLTGFIGFIGTGALVVYMTLMDDQAGFVPRSLRATAPIILACFLGIAFTASKTYLGTVGKDAQVALTSAKQTSPGRNGNEWACQVRLPDNTVRKVTSCSDAMVGQPASNASDPTANVEGVTVAVVWDPNERAIPHPGTKSTLGPPLAYGFGAIGITSLVGGLITAATSAARNSHRTRRTPTTQTH